MIKRILQGYLEIDELKRRADDTDERLDDIDQRVRDVKLQAETTLRHSGNFKKRTNEELELMKKQIKDALDAVEALIESGELEDELRDAKTVRKRLRNNVTRIDNARKALALGG